MVLHVFREHLDLRLEQVVAGAHRFELRHKIFDHLMLDCRLIDHLCGFGQLADRRIEQLLLDLRMHSEGAADRCDQRCHVLVVVVLLGVLVLVEEIFDGFVVLLQQIDGVGHAARWQSQHGASSVIVTHAEGSSSAKRQAIGQTLHRA